MQTIVKTISTHFRCGPNSPNVSLYLTAFKQVLLCSNCRTSTFLTSHLSHCVNVLSHTPDSCFSFSSWLTFYLTPFNTLQDCLLQGSPCLLLLAQFRYDCLHLLLCHPVIILHMQWRLHTGHGSTLHIHYVPWAHIILCNHFLFHSTQYILYLLSICKLHSYVGMFSLWLVSTRPLSCILWQFPTDLFLLSLESTVVAFRVKALAIPPNSTLFASLLGHWLALWPFSWHT